MHLHAFSCPPHATPVQNSRVGQATVSIVDYIRRHQDAYLKNTGTGVPERMLRWAAAAAVQLAACSAGGHVLPRLAC